MAQPEYAALPPASQEPRSFVVVGGTLYWSDGTQWYQVAPASGGGAALEEPVVDYTYVVF